MKHPFILPVFFLMLAFSQGAGQAQAQQAAAMTVPAVTDASATPSAITDPLTVADVEIDKTAANAVVARDEAIVEARRAAFQKLAERNMTAAEAAALKMPGDDTLATLVQDFEIKNERLSSTRYKASFLVRFRDGVRNYIKISEPAPVTADAAPADGSPAGAATAAERIVVPPSATVLVLPYMETTAGKTILWEDPNPWRLVWQNDTPKLPESVSQYIVPLGDISDVTAGSSETAWSGDYSVLEKLRANYRADEVVLAVASKTGATVKVDIYSYKDGHFARRTTIAPAINEIMSEADAYRRAATETLRYLQEPVYAERPRDIVADISRELTDGVSAGAGSAPVVMVPPAGAMPATSGATEVEAAMSFDNFMTWMETQKRLSEMVPPVRVDIQKISKTGAGFTLRFQGDMASLQRVLAEKGLMLAPPATMPGDGAALDASGVAIARPAPPYTLYLTR